MHKQTYTTCTFMRKKDKVTFLQYVSVTFIFRLGVTFFSKSSPSPIELYTNNLIYFLLLLSLYSHNNELSFLL